MDLWRTFGVTVWMGVREAVHRMGKVEGRSLKSYLVPANIKTYNDHQGPGCNAELILIELLLVIGVAYIFNYRGLVWVKCPSINSHICNSSISHPFANPSICLTTQPHTYSFIYPTIHACMHPIHSFIFLTLNPWYSCFCISNSRITCVRHHPGYFFFQPKWAFFSSRHLAMPIFCRDWSR